MDNKNSDLLHGMLFAITAIVMVYAGEQVRGGAIGYTASLMKASAGSSALSIIMLALSFVFAVKSVRFGKSVTREEGIIQDWYYYEGRELQRLELKTVKNIDERARYVGYYGTMQRIYHVMNMVFTILSVSLLIVSVLMYSVGVILYG